MKSLAYTVGGALVEPLLALRERGERVQIRSLRHFSSAETGFDAVILEVEDGLIRQAYESIGTQVTVLSDYEGAKKTDKKQGASDGAGTRGRNRQAGR